MLWRADPKLCADRVARAVKTLLPESTEAVMEAVRCMVKQGASLGAGVLTAEVVRVADAPKALQREMRRKVIRVLTYDRAAARRYKNRRLVESCLGALRI